MKGDVHVNSMDVCGDPAALAGYLYDECGPDERAAIDAHLAVCVSCAAEVAALAATRAALAAWTPPESELGFRITSERETAREATVLRPARWWARPLPAWAQAAAAAAIFVAGATLGARSGSLLTPDAAPPAGAVGDRPPVAAAASPAAVTRDDMARLEQRLRDEIGAVRASGAPAAAPVTASSDEQVLQRIGRMLAESEERQQREFAVRLSQVIREVEAQRRLDLARIERTFGQIEGATRPELAEQRQLLNYLIRTASQRPQ